MPAEDGLTAQGEHTTFNTYQLWWQVGAGGGWGGAGRQAGVVTPGDHTRLPRAHAAHPWAHLARAGQAWMGEHQVCQQPCVQRGPRHCRVCRRAGHVDHHQMAVARAGGQCTPPPKAGADRAVWRCHAGARARWARTAWCLVHAHAPRASPRRDLIHPASTCTRRARFAEFDPVVERSNTVVVVKHVTLVSPERHNGPLLEERAHLGARRAAPPPPRTTTRGQALASRGRVPVDRRPPQRGPPSPPPPTHPPDAPAGALQPPWRSTSPTATST